MYEENDHTRDRLVEDLAKLAILGAIVIGGAALAAALLGGGE